METEAVPKYSAPSEQLPPYQASLEYFGVALMKTEFITPYHCNSGKREWRPVVLELCSTELNVYELKVEKKLEELVVALYREMNSVTDKVEAARRETRLALVRDSVDNDVAGSDMVDAYSDENNSVQLLDSAKDKIKKSWKRSKTRFVIGKQLSRYHSVLKDNGMLFEPTNSREVFDNFKFKGPLVSCMTLNHSKVGRALSLNQALTGMCCEDFSDSELNESAFVKYDNVLRARIESKQILFQFWSFFGMVNWLWNLNTGKDLSAPVESRSPVRVKTIPGRFSRRNNALLDAILAESEYDIGGQENELNVRNDTDKSCADNASQVSSEEFMLDGSTISSGPGSDGAESQNSMFSTPPVYSVAAPNSDSRVTRARSTTSIDGYDLVSYARSYTPLEERYISGCLPRLNSFDTWNGQQITLSNYTDYLPQRKAKEVLDKKGLKNLYISQSELKNVALKLEKRLMSNDKRIESRQCKNFLIHQHGLVSVVKEESV